MDGHITPGEAIWASILAALLFYLIFFIGLIGIVFFKYLGETCCVAEGEGGSKQRVKFEPEAIRGGGSTKSGAGAMMQVGAMRFR